MAQCYRHNWVGLPGEMCPRCCDEAAALTARLASLESDLARVTAELKAADLRIAELGSLVDALRSERDRLSAGLTETRDHERAKRENVMRDRDSCKARAERAERMIAAHEWAASIDGYPACTECGESPHATDTGTGEPIPGTHIPGCAWGEAAKRGKTPGGEG